jgi:hypothetical protein
LTRVAERLLADDSLPAASCATNVQTRDEARLVLRQLADLIAR